jgi:hypothetical protein
MLTVRSQQRVVFTTAVPSDGRVEALDTKIEAQADSGSRVREADGINLRLRSVRDACCPQG